jgi:hypothetical protein
VPVTGRSKTQRPANQIVFSMDRFFLGSQVTNPC